MLHRMKAHSGPKQRPGDSQRPAERRRKRQCWVSFSNQPTVSQSMTLTCPLAEQGLKAETQTWRNHHNSRLKWLPFWKDHPQCQRRRTRKCYQSHPYPSLPNGCNRKLRSVMSPTGGWNYLLFCWKTQED